MIIRKIRGPEIKRTGELYALAFEFGAAESRSAEEIYRQISAEPQSREDFYWQERWAAFEDDDVTMMSFFVAKPLPVHFDGAHTTMTGIGGVATLPQYRRRGGIRACFAAALPDMYGRGMAFSYLYPFSTAYYRKFGYETGAETIRYEIRLDSIPAFPVTGNCYLCEPNGPVPLTAALTDIQTIYRDWQNRYNLMVANEDFEYAWVAASNPVRDQVFTYVYRNGGGSAEAYATFRSLGEAGDRDLVCSRFVFRDREGFQGLLRLAQCYAGDHRAIIFNLPLDQTVAYLLPEWSMDAVKREIVPAGMVRVIDAARVLRMARYRGSGSLVIEIADEYIPQNNGRFQVTFSAGRAEEVRRVGDKRSDISGEMAPAISRDMAPAVSGEMAPAISRDMAPAISLGIGDFSRLITGAFPASMLPLLPSICIYGDPAAIEKVFYPKPCYIMESF